MNEVAKSFFKLSKSKKRLVHIYLCEISLEIWNEYISKSMIVDYVESVCGTKQIIDKLLPTCALDAVKNRKEVTEIYDKYSEPITAILDLDLKFPENIEFAYYAVYNLYRKYVCKEKIDDWIIVNQALSSLEDIDKVQNLLLEAIENSSNSA